MEARRTPARRQSPARWTYAEFARLTSDTGERHEVIAGELVVTPSPGTRHQRVVTNLVTVLEPFVQANELGWVFPGPIDVLFAEGDYLVPDLVFVRRERRGIVSDRGIEAAPDLVVEVASPSTAERDQGLKRERYAHFGVPEYWVVDPDARRIDRWRLALDPAEPEVAYERFLWQPIPGGPSLEVPVREVTADLDG